LRTPAAWLPLVAAPRGIVIITRDDNTDRGTRLLPRHHEAAGMTGRDLAEIVAGQIR
jgi:hypothetical protein